MTSLLKTIVTSLLVISAALALPSAAVATAIPSFSLPNLSANTFSLQRFQKSQAFDVPRKDAYLNDADNYIKSTTDGWYGFIKIYAVRLFWILVAADVAYWALISILQKQDMMDMAGSLVKKMLTILFFWGLLAKSDDWVPQVLASFQQIALGVSAIGNQILAFTPGTVVALGDRIFTNQMLKLGQRSLLEHVATVLPVFMAAFIAFCCCLYMGIQYFIVRVESYIALSGGIILLGFGGSRFSREYVNSYMKYVVSVGLKMMFMILVLYQGWRDISLFIANSQFQDNQLIAETVRMMGITLIYTFFMAAIPKIVGGLMGGGPTLGMAEASGMALTAAAAGGGALMGAVAGVTGAGSRAKESIATALGSGARSAMESMPSGAARAVGDAVSSSGPTTGLGSVIGASSSGQGAAASVPGSGLLSSAFSSGRESTSASSGHSTGGASGSSSTSGAGAAINTTGASKPSDTSGGTSGSSRGDINAQAVANSGSQSKVQSATAPPAADSGSEASSSPEQSATQQAFEGTSRISQTADSAPEEASPADPSQHAQVSASSNNASNPGAVSADTKSDTVMDGSSIDAQENFIAGQNDGDKKLKEAKEPNVQKVAKVGVVESAKNMAQNIKSLEGFVLDDRASLGGGGFNMPGHEE